MVGGVVTLALAVFLDLLFVKRKETCEEKWTERINEDSHRLKMKGRFSTARL
jgi:hypothetical protein